MMYDSEKMRARVMRRVYIAYVVRRVLMPLPLKFIALVAIASFSAGFVSVGQVVRNFGSISAIGDMYRFGVSAFQNTELVVQVGVVLAAVVALFIIRDLARTFLSAR